MNTDTSPALGPRATIAASIGLFLLAIGLLCLCVIGLTTNETMGFSRHQPGLVSRQDNPVEFWITESVSLLFAAMLGLQGIKLLRRALGQLRQ